MVLYQVCSNGAPGSQIAPGQVALGLNHRNTQKKSIQNLLLQNHLAQMLEILVCSLPSDPLPGLSPDEGLRVQNGPTQKGPGSEP